MAGYSGGAGLTNTGTTAPPVRPQGTVRGTTPRAAMPRPQNVNRPAAPGQAHPTPSTRGHWVPVGDNWVLIHATGRNQWAAGGVPGAAAPPKPTGSTPPPTNPLASLTPNQIRQTATNTVNQAYGGALSDINSQQQQAKALYDTQQHANDAFASWLATKSEEMTSQVGQVNQKLADTLAGIRSTQASTLAGLPGQAAQAVEGQSGIVSQPGQIQQAEQNLTGPTLAVGNMAFANREQAQVNQGLTTNNAVAAMGEINQARVGALRQSELSDLNKSLTSIAAERTKALAARTGDIGKEIARLQGVEINKAQWKVNERAALAAAGVKQDVALADAKSTRIRALASATNADTGALRAKENARHNAAMEKINSSRYATQAQHAAAVVQEKARHDGVMEGIAQQNANTRAAGGTGAAKGKPQFGTPTQQRSVVNYIEKVRQALITDIERFHKGDPRALQLAYHDLLNGNAKKQGIAVGKPPSGADPSSYLNAASNTLTQYGAQGLTPGDIAFLNQEGLQVGGRYPRSTGRARNAGRGGAPSAGDVNTATGAR